MLSYANTLDRIEQQLQDSANAVYTATELGYLIEDGLKRISEYSPYIIEATYQVESRTGKDTLGTASKLTDSTKSQFLAADATNEKVVHNITDDTWAVVTGYTSTSVLSLSKDIMDSGEEYEIYNKRCKNKRQIYLGDSPPYIRIENYPEYPVGTERTFKLISRDIIELDVEDGTIEDSNSTLTTLGKVDVLVKFQMSQILCQLTDLAGAVHTTVAAGATSMQVKNFTDTEIIKVGDMFNIADHRTTYTVITQVTLANQATTGSTLAFYPALEAGATADDVITFVGSTLQAQHERILRDLVAGEAIISKSSLPLQEIVNSIAVLATASTAIGNMTNRILQAVNDIISGRTAINLTPAIILEANTSIDNMTNRITQATTDIASGRTSASLAPAIILRANIALEAIAARITQAINDLTSGRTEAAKGVDLITTEANEAIAKIDAKLIQALADLDIGRTKINLVNKGGPGVPTDFANYAAGEVNIGRGYLVEAQGYFQQAQADEQLALSYRGLAAGELSAAVDKLNEARGFLGQVASDLSVASAYGGLAVRELEGASANLRQANGYLSQVNADLSVGNSYGNLGARELNNAAQYLNQGIGYLRKINTALSLAGASRYSQEWGERKIIHAERELSQMATPKMARICPRGIA